MRNSKRKVFVVCEDHEYKDSNKVIGLFPTREEAENCIRQKGKVVCWKAEYFMSFALVWAQLQTIHAAYGRLSAWYWIEVHEIDLPLPKPRFFWDVLAMALGIVLVLIGITMHHRGLSDVLVLIGCVANLVGFVSAFLKA